MQFSGAAGWGLTGTAQIAVTAGDDFINNGFVVI
jgi:hypothetical protein